jgi:hypothetical protein
VAVFVIAYAAASLLLGGLAAMYEIWHRPMMLDRADGRGKFPSPKMSAVEVVLFVAVLWPILAVVATLDVMKARR